MALGLPARHRVDALDERMEALSGRLDEVTARVGDLAAGFDRVSNELAQVHRRLDEEASDRRDQRDQLSGLRRGMAELQVEAKMTANLVAKLRGDGNMAADGIADLQSRNAATADAVADLEAASGRTVERVAAHSSVLDSLEEEHRRQGRSLDQLRADVIRIERQAAADLAELRTTGMALARVALNVDRPRSSTAGA